MKGIRAVVTYNCNIMCSNCKFKCAPYRKGIMGVSDFYRKFKDAYDEGYRDYLLIEGGETFLHTGIIFKYVKKISSININKSIVTNGFWGNIDPYLDMLQDFKKIGVNEIIIEYDYFHSAFIDKQTIMESIRKCMKSDLNVSIRSTFLTKDIKSEEDKATFELVKDFKKEFKKIKFIFDEINHYDRSNKSFNEKTILYKQSSKFQREF
jgi:MoaA/NifB/PqqE/SkfB family radical SAM enzyme